MPINIFGEHTTTIYPFYFGFLKNLAQSVLSAKQQVMHIENLSSSRRVSLSKHKQRFIQMIFVVGNGPVGGQYSNPSSRADSRTQLSNRWRSNIVDFPCNDTFYYPSHNTYTF